ncbi:NAD-dependent epimerase/dehydratase family protein [Pelagibius litoralis]|uniref:NAD-dependent epimerase/dehydratase family protein n=1 Tax=Pelagibius litoralis TaxID=374515 RepID=A0A967EWX5_9PROT|nr:D-erythronate dehydrogenase [Pelagibius litoralis]NIA68838.1 NAD-dependent epimerase/dehydratase family protein [Pelagibius litoralis]
MKVVITGGAGFIGLRLAEELLRRGRLTGPSGEPEAIDSLLLFDVSEPPARPAWADDRVTFQSGDISDAATVSGLIDRDDISVFHLASVVSGGGELDFDLAMRVNLHGGLNVFEACRARSGLPRLVFASSIAVFGGAGMPAVVGDHVKQTPQTTYGMTKTICELLVNDYTRKGFLDGRSARLPTVIVRPGKPNQAASSFVSGLFREPLNGEVCRIPVAPETMMPVLGYRSIVGGFIALHEADGEALGDDRAVSLPSFTVSVAEMIEALNRVASGRSLGEIVFEPDPFIEAICAGWPQDASHDRATALGLPKDASLDVIVENYIEDYL